MTRGNTLSYVDVAIPVLLSRAAFSSEKTYTFTTANGQVYIGYCFHEYCYHVDGSIVRREEFLGLDRNNVIHGLVACKFLYMASKELACVNLPCPPGNESENVLVPFNSLVSRPSVSKTDFSPTPACP